MGLQVFRGVDLVLCQVVLLLKRVESTVQDPDSAFGDSRVGVGWYIAKGLHRLLYKTKTPGQSLGRGLESRNKSNQIDSNNKCTVRY